MNDFLMNVTANYHENNTEINKTSYFEDNNTIFLEKTVII